MTTASENSQPTADEALARLLTGNQRFMQGESRLAESTKKPADLASGQQPFATILGCSDSRVPPEWIFDADLGELFVIRVAGNVLSPEVAGSLQYANAHLRTPLFVVLGHEGCGAVKAALDTRYQGARHRSRIQILVNSILPGIAEVDPQLPPPVLLSRAVESNVRWSVKQIVKDPEAQATLAEGRIKIVGAFYEITTGRVRLLSSS